MNENDKRAFIEFFLEEHGVDLRAQEKCQKYWQAALEYARNKQAEPVSWQFYDESTDKWCNGMDVNDHRKHTEAAGIKTRDLYTEAPAVAVNEQLLEALEEMVSVARCVDGWEFFPSLPIERAETSIKQAEAAKGGE